MVSVCIIVNKLVSMKTSSRIAFQFTLFTAVTALLILLFINISFFVTWHHFDRQYLAGISLQQDRIEAIKAALQKNNRRFIMPSDIEPQGFPPALEEPVSVDAMQKPINYSRKVVDIIQANDERRYMILSDTR